MDTDPRQKEDEQLLRAIIEAFTKHPARLKIETEERGRGATMLNLWADINDYPKIIGKQGKHITAIRTMFLYIAKREGRSISIMPNEPTPARREELPPFRDDPNWSPDHAIALLRRVLDRILRRPYKTEPHENDEQTVIMIEADESERRIADTLKPYLHTIWHAIGKHEGRRLYIQDQQAVPEMT